MGLCFGPVLFSEGARPFSMRRRTRHAHSFKLDWSLPKGSGQVAKMSELNSKVSFHLLSLLRGETLRVILRDGRVMEGTVIDVSREQLQLDGQVIPVESVATYFVLKGE